MARKQISIKSLDAIWSRVVKILAGFKCEHCGRMDIRLNSHHVFGRRAKSVRWDVKNGVCLCVLCHRFSSKFSAHETPTLFDEWIINHRGKRWYNALRARHNQMWDGDREKVKAMLKKIETKGKP